MDGTSSTWSSSTAIIRTRLFAQTGRVVEVRSAKRALAFMTRSRHRAIPKALVRFVDETFRRTSPAGWRIAEEAGTLVVVVRTSESRHRIPSFQSVCAGEVPSSR